MKKVSEQLKEISRGNYYVPEGLAQEIIAMIKERDSFIIGENEKVGLPTTQPQEQENYNKKQRNELRTEQRNRASESIT